jgi:hypothetical protein
MTTDIQLRNVLKKDQNGDTYSVPENMLNEFTRLNENIQNTATLSDEWFEAQEEFDSIFLTYLVQ